MSASVSILITGSLAAVGLVALAWTWPRLRGTTLVAPWCWALGSLLAISLVEIATALLSDSAPPEWAPPVHFAAAVTSFCPAMALLGAKRPQDRGWQFIVLSLWVVLSLPSLQWLMFGGTREIHPARGAFLLILLGCGVLNGIATRFCLASLLMGAGQAALLSAQLPLPWIAELAESGPLVGLGLIVASHALSAAGLPRGRAAATPLDRLWLDFRDAFGAVWGLRVAQRVNASAAMFAWPVMLEWSGFRPGPANPDDLTTVVVPPAVEECLSGLLWRFVSPAWIAARLGRTPSAPSVEMAPPTATIP